MKSIKLTTFILMMLSFFVWSCDSDDDDDNPLQPSTDYVNYYFNFNSSPSIFKEDQVIEKEISEYIKNSVKDLTETIEKPKTDAALLAEDTRRVDILKIRLAQLRETYNIDKFKNDTTKFFYFKNETVYRRGFDLLHSDIFTLVLPEMKNSKWVSADNQASYFELTSDSTASFSLFGLTGTAKYLRSITTSAFVLVLPDNSSFLFHYTSGIRCYYEDKTNNQKHYFVKEN